MKRKLLFAIVALLCSITTWAQRDITSTYITNATLSDGTNGWTKTHTKNTQTNDPADAFSNSVRGNNTVGYASEAYAGWGSLIQTAYSMKQTITLPAGNYRLVCYAFFRQGQAYNTNSSKSLAFLKAGSSQVALKTLGSITAAGYANSQAEGANCFDSKMYRNVVEFTSDGSPIEIGVYGTFDEAYSWCIVGMFELFDMDDLASVSSPTDVTYAITNPGFEYRDLTGWTNTGLKYQNNNWANKSGVGFAEQWSNAALGSDKSITQTLTNMPAGLYELSVYGHNILQSESDAPKTGMFLKANSNQTPIGAYGQYKVRTTLTSDGDLTIGINLDNCAGNWIAFDRFELKFFGDPLEAYKDMLEDAVNNAQALVDGNTIPDAAESALQTIINNNDNDDNAFTEESQFSTAIDNINTAYDTYKVLETNYAAWISMKAYADALVAVENTNASANNTLASAISTQNTAAEAATTAEDIATATSALKTAMITYAGAADPTSGNRFNLTFMLTNPDLTDFASWTSYTDVEGWYSDQPDGNRQTMHNDGAAGSHGDAFFEYWSEAPKANGKFALYMKPTLPVGTYTINCDAFAGQPTGGDNCAVYFYANDTQGSLVNNYPMAEKEISFINDSEQEVKIGLKPLTGNTYRWMGIGYVKLYKEYTDNTTYNITTNISNANVDVTVDGNTATSAKALKTVTLTVSNITEGYVINSVTATYNDGEVKNLDVANPSTNVYTYQQPAYDVTVTINVVVDKAALNTAIAAATAARKASNEGAGVFQIPAAAGTTLASAITTAQGVYDNASATVSDVETAIENLKAAETVYANAELNTPADGQKYYIKVATAEHAKLNNAVMIYLGTTTGNNPTGYGLNCNYAPNSNLAQAITFTQVSGNTYNISFTTAEGTTYMTYGSLNGSAAGWAAQQIQATTDASKKGEFKIVATNTAHVFKIYNTVDNNYIDCQARGNIYTDTEIEMDQFTLAEASQASVSVNLGAGKYGTRIFPFTPSLPSGVTAYSCEANEGDVLTLVDVASPAANKPYIIYSENGYTGDALTGWGLAGATSYTEGYLTGVYDNQKIAASVDATETEDGAYRYVLQTQNEVQAFYKVDAEFTATANRAFLTVPQAKTGSDVKALFFDFNGETGLENLNVNDNLNKKDEAIYNLAGQRVAKAQKGLYIVNGKKVVVK